MDEIEINVRMPRALWEAASRLAAQQDIALDQLMRQALSAQLLKTRGALGRAGSWRVSPLMKLHGLLAGDFEKAESWSDLQSRLQSQGYALREAIAGLELITYPAGQRLCATAKLGFTMEEFVSRFNAPFPNASQNKVGDCVSDAAKPRGKWHKEPAAQPAKKGPEPAVNRGV